VTLFESTLNYVRNQLGMLLACAMFSFAQSAPSTASQSSPNVRFDEATPPLTYGPVDVLSPTSGVDLTPYLSDVLHRVKLAWYNLVPGSARAPNYQKGKVAIEFAILRDGEITGMRMEDGGSSGDGALDRAAWGGITASAPFPPLPTEFVGKYVALRFHFYYNREIGDSGWASPPYTVPPEIYPSFGPASQPVNPNVKVALSPGPKVTVPAGGWREIKAAVTGSSNVAVKWTIKGEGCSGSACGAMTGNVYFAPYAPPRPNAITLTAISEANPNASASITLHIGRGSGFVP
jgi:TonB family protein